MEKDVLLSDGKTELKAKCVRQDTELFLTLENDNGKVKQIDFIRNAIGIAKDEKIGKYVLHTNRTDLSEEEISKIHRSLAMARTASEV